MENCIFCKIVKGEISAQKTFENDEFIAFLDIHPKAPGHTLLVPKAHHQWFLDLPEGLYQKMFATVRDLSLTLKEERGADYIQVGIVGKDVPHTHVHLIPRKMSEKDSPTV